MGKNCSTALAPGFRFHPTDEELVWYYLRRKVNGKSFRLDAISEIDIYKVEPNDLPGLSKLKTRDLEWYFFSALDRKYGNGSRTNRATNEGYWKTTGKDRPVYHKSQLVGMKKTLVYHKGRAPRGERSNWVMHEYKLSDEVLEKTAFPDGFVLCRVFQKSGTGPKNGEQYGAPLVEEEWEDDNSRVVEPTEVSFDDPYNDYDACIEQIDLDQGMTGTDQSCVVQESDENFCPNDLVSQKFPELVPNDESNACVVTNEHMIQPNDTSNEAPFDLPDVFFDSINFLQSVEDHADSGLESYLDEDLFWKSFIIDPHPPCALDSQGLANDDIHSIWQTPDASQPLPRTSDDSISSSSKQVMEVSKAEPSKTDIENSWLSQANSLLDNIPAPPAFASEFPSKDVAARLHAAVQSSASVNVTAGMIRIWDMPTEIGESGLQWSFDKAGNVNVLLSFDLPQVVNPVGSESLTGLLSSKMSLWLMFFLVFVFGLSTKFLTCIYAK